MLVVLGNGRLFFFERDVSWEHTSSDFKIQAEVNFRDHVFQKS